MRPAKIANTYTLERDASQEWMISKPERGIAHLLNELQRESRLICPCNIRENESGISG